MSNPTAADMVEMQDAQSTMAQAANDLFENCDAGEILLPVSQLPVKINAVKIKQMNELVKFIQTFLQSLDQEKIISLITRVSEHQEAAIHAGQDPYKLGTLSKIKDMLGEAGIVFDVLTNGLDQLGPLVEMFTDLTADQFGELDLDEGFLVGLHILGRNYHFFIQRCVPVIRAYTTYLQSKRPKTPRASNNAPVQST